MPIRLQLFGPPTIDDGGKSSLLAFERRTQLLALLALKATWVGRAEIAAMLWPDQETRLAFANLRKTLFRLQNVDWAVGLESTSGAVRFDADTDVAAFETALREGRTGDALRHYRGDLLAGFDDDQSDMWNEWLEFERNRLRVAWRAAALEHLAGNVEAESAIALSGRLLESDPLDEAALRAHLTWLARTGDLSRARRAYRTFAERLAEDTGLSPGPELKALHDAIGSGAVDAARPPLSASAAARGKPTAADDGFVGRTTELRRIAELLAKPDCRWLTLLGPGGIGKTRLAQRALLDLAPGFTDGVAFIALEDAHQPSDLGSQLARDLDVRLAGGAEPLEQVIAWLRNRQMLLVLDNVDQLAVHASMFDEMLRACAGIRVLATSRVRLVLRNEWLLPLDGLACPEIEDQDRIEAFDAARLFIRAAQRVEPSLLPAVEADAIADICRQVGGLPLALELAAAWTRVLSCVAIADELRRSSELLRTVDPARPQRQASIEAVFEQSWAHLGDSERRALARLALFRGGFTADAARSIADIRLPVLAALTDKSLLKREGQRHFLHPLVQQLAAGKLAPGDEHDAMARAHSRHFLRLLAAERRKIRHADRTTLLAIDAELDNVRAAWRWALAAGPADDLARAAPSLMSFCDHRGLRIEGVSLLREALDGASARTEPRVAAVIEAAAAHLEYRLDHYAEAESLATRGLAGAEASGDTATQLQCFQVIGASAARVGRLADARRAFQRVMRLSQEIGDATNVAATLDNLGLIERMLGRFDESLRLYGQALLQHRALGDAGGEALCLNNLGVVHVLRHELDAARDRLLAARALCERHGLPTTRCMIENNLADLAMRGADWATARGHAERALELSATTGQRAVVVEARQVLMRLALKDGDLAGARAELRALLEEALAIGRTVSLTHAVARFAELLAAQGAADCACRVMGFALQQPGLVGTERDEAAEQLAHWRREAGTITDAEWTGPSLVELAQRIVVETPHAHAPLIAMLRSQSIENSR
jgi:predicted ATPase/DNA-binding SARP family transcriptional activator